MKWPPAGDRRRDERGVDLDAVQTTTDRLCELVGPLRETLNKLAAALDPLVRSAEDDDQ